MILFKYHNFNASLYEFGEYPNNIKRMGIWMQSL
jgi:hypothetical protein